MQKLLAFVSIIFLLVLIVSAVVVSVGLNKIKSPGPLDQSLVHEVPRGASMKEIAQTLENKNVIKSALLFEIYARIYESDKAMKAGEYQFSRKSSIRDVVSKLRDGDVLLHQITIPEGLTNHQITTLLNKNEMLSGEISDMPPEGYLLPETYSFERGRSRQEIVQRMHDAKKEALAELWPQRQEGLPLNTMDEAVILASIVEKETAVAEERDKVAGVFVTA